MAVKGLTLTDVQEFISKNDPAQTEDDGATVFLFRPLPSHITSKLQDKQGVAEITFGEATTQRIINQTSTKDRECCRLGLTGWRNFKDEDGRDIPFQTEQAMEGGLPVSVVTNATLDCIPLILRSEIGQAIWRASTMTVDDAKKFEALSSVLDGSRTSSAGNAMTTTNDGEDATDQQREKTVTEGTGATP